MDSLRRFFDEAAPRWATRVVDMDLMEDLLDRVGVNAGWRILDLGGGTGHLLRSLRRRVGPTGRVGLMDLSCSMLELAASASEAARALRCCGAAEALPLRPGQWDAVIGMGLYPHLADRAAAFLAEGWSYTLTVPRSQRRIRLACAWPILIGARTLTKVRAAAQGDFPCARAPVKVRRGEVRRILAESILRYPFPESWNRLLARWMAKP